MTRVEIKYLIRITNCPIYSNGVNVLIDYVRNPFRGVYLDRRNLIAFAQPGSGGAIGFVCMG